MGDEILDLSRDYWQQPNWGILRRPQVDVAADTLPEVECIVVLDGVEPIDAEGCFLDEFVAMGKDIADSEVHARIDSIEPDDLAPLIYAPELQESWGGHVDS